MTNFIKLYLSKNIAFDFKALSGFLIPGMHFFSKFSVIEIYMKIYY